MSNGHSAQQQRSISLGIALNRCFSEQKRVFTRDEQSPDSVSASGFDHIASSDKAQQERRAQHAMQGYGAAVDRAARGEWRDPHHPLQNLALELIKIAITPPEQSFRFFEETLGPSATPQRKPRRSNHGK